MYSVQQVAIVGNIALIGLLLIDDTKDADTDEYANENKKKEGKKIDKAVKSEFQVTEKDEGEEKISDKLVSGLKLAIEKKGLDSLVVQAVLGSYDYKSLNEIKNKDYMQIVSDLKGAKN